jgi:predicted amidohydrolase
MMPNHNILIRGGTVIDPANGIHQKADIAISDGVFNVIGKTSGTAVEEICASGYIAVPGLIDIHTHLWPLTEIGIRADSYCFPSGITTAVDAGSAGSKTYEQHRDMLHSGAARVLAFLNVSAKGLAGISQGPEDIDPAHFSLEEITRIVKQYSNEIMGLKIRMSQNIAGDLRLGPLQETCALARRLGVKVMVHSTDPPGTMAELINCLSCGDILTHAYHGRGDTIISDNMEAAIHARNRGVFFDIGEAGTWHFSKDVFSQAMKQGFFPDTISSDVTTNSWYKKEKAFSLPMVMSRLMNLGMSLFQVIECTTWNAAKILGIEDTCGSLTPGTAADLTVFHEVKSVNGACLKPVLTIKNGCIVYRDVTL